MCLPLPVFLQDLKPLVDVISKDFLYLLEFLFLMEILQNCLKFFLAVLGNEKGHGLDGVDFFSESIKTALAFPDLGTFVAAVETFFFTAFGIRAHPVRGAFRI